MTRPPLLATPPPALPICPRLRFPPSLLPSRQQSLPCLPCPHPLLPSSAPLPSPQVRFVVMNNVFRTEVPLHSKYDLKGSTLGRTVGAKMSATGERAAGAGGRGGAGESEGWPGLLKQGEQSWGSIAARCSAPAGCMAGPRPTLDAPAAISLYRNNRCRPHGAPQPSARTSTWMCGSSWTWRRARGEPSAACTAGAAWLLAGPGWCGRPSCSPRPSTPQQSLASRPWRRALGKASNSPPVHLPAALLTATRQLS